MSKETQADRRRRRSTTNNNQQGAKSRRKFLMRLGLIGTGLVLAEEGWRNFIYNPQQSEKNEKAFQETRLKFAKDLEVKIGINPSSTDEEIRAVSANLTINNPTALTNARLGSYTSPLGGEISINTNRTGEPANIGVVTHYSEGTFPTPERPTDMRVIKVPSSDPHTNINLICDSTSQTACQGLIDQPEISAAINNFANGYLKDVPGSKSLVIEYAFNRGLPILDLANTDVQITQQRATVLLRLPSIALAAKLTSYTFEEMLKLAAANERASFMILPDMIEPFKKGALHFNEGVSTVYGFIAANDPEMTRPLTGVSSAEFSAFSSAMEKFIDLKIGHKLSADII